MLKEIKMNFKIKTIDFPILSGKMKIMMKEKIIRQGDTISGEL
jgi:hypothetical protein